MVFAIAQRVGRELPEVLSYEMVQTVLMGFLRVFRHPVHERVFTTTFILQVLRGRGWSFAANGLLSQPADVSDDDVRVGRSWADAYGFGLE